MSNNNNDVCDTFKMRANNYNNDMTWLEKSNIIMPMLPDCILGKGQALDVCTGTGVIAHNLISKGWNVTAVDISQEMLEKVPKNVKCVLADICDMPFQDNSFDLVTCRQGLQYVDLETAIMSLYRVSSNEIRIGHVTINDEIDYGFWKEFHLKASPGRKHVFIPGQIEITLNKLGIKIKSKEVIYDKSAVTPPLMYLPTSERNKLISSIVGQSQSFYERNGIEVVDENNILRNRRWEFYVCGK